MQTHTVIQLYPESRFPSAAHMRREKRDDNLKRAAAIVDLTVTAAIGLGVLVCFGLVFTML